MYKLLIVDDEKNSGWSGGNSLGFIRYYVGRLNRNEPYWISGYENVFKQ